LPELPIQRASRYVNDFEFSREDAMILAQEKETSDYFEEVAKLSGNPRSALNWITVELFRELKESKLEVRDSKISPMGLGALIRLVDQKTISGKIGKEVFAEMWRSGSDPGVIVKQKGLQQISDNTSLEPIADKIIAKNPNQVKEYKEGKTKLLTFFVGQMMKETKGQASPEQVHKILKEKLGG